MTHRDYTLGKVRRVLIEMEDGMVVVCHNPDASEAIVSVEIERFERFSSRSGLQMRDLSVITRTQTNVNITLSRLEELEVRDGKLLHDGKDLMQDLKKEKSTTGRVFFLEA